MGVTYVQKILYATTLSLGSCLIVWGCNAKDFQVKNVTWKTYKNDRYGSDSQDFQNYYRLFYYIPHSAPQTVTGVNYVEKKLKKASKQTYKVKKGI